MKTIVWTQYFHCVFKTHRCGPGLSVKLLLDEHRKLQVFFFSFLSDSQCFSECKEGFCAFEQFLGISYYYYYYFFHFKPRDKMSRAWPKIRNE